MNKILSLILLLVVLNVYGMRDNQLQQLQKLDREYRDTQAALLGEVTACIFSGGTLKAFKDGYLGEPAHKDILEFGCAVVASVAMGLVGANGLKMLWNRNEKVAELEKTRRVYHSPQKEKLERDYRIMQFLLPLVFSTTALSAGAAYTNNQHGYIEPFSLVVAVANYVGFVSLASAMFKNREDMIKELE